MRNTKRRKIAAFFAALLFAVTLNTGALAADDTRMLVPLGNTAGIKLYADGILVVSMSQVSHNGKECSPAADAGVQPGDRILEVNGIKVDSTEQLRDLVNAAERLTLSIKREDEMLHLEVEPMISDADGAKKLGAWVRDSLAGIGTLTYYEPATGIFGALGHGVTDTDTKTLMPLASGSLVRSSVASVRKGTAGSPGELQGSFDTSDEYGTLLSNTECGVFGRVDPADLQLSCAALPAASIEEVMPGDAVILSAVSGDQPEEYTVKILSVNEQSELRNLLLEVTDPRLVEATGGIVQGMSGSPILQNGKLVGAVTHVLVREPLRGYGIFIGNMLDEADGVQQAAA